MSLAQVKLVIENFIQNNRNDLLVIKGDWGVGKTYFWQDLIKRFRQENQTRLKNYAYVSLFGVGNAESLKNLITASFLESKILPNKESSKIKNLFNDFPNKLQNLLKNIPYINLVPIGLASDLAFLTVKDTLICFDDIERMGKGFDTAYLNGLACLLKEQRNCKIVFILNDRTLPNEEEFNKHKEKIVDIELNFSPLPEEAFSYIFDELQPFYEITKTYCLKLSIKNVRILQRIQRYIQDLLEYIQDVEKVVAEDIIRSIIVLVWSYYDNDSDSPPIEFFKDLSYASQYLKKKDKKENISTNEEKWHSLLYSYGYRNTDEVDRQLIFFVEKGYLDTDIFLKEIAIRNQQAISQQGKDSYGKAWDLWGNSFNHNEKEFVDQLNSSFRSNIKYLSLDNLQTTVETLRELQQNDIANNLVDEYINTHFGTEYVMKRPWGILSYRIKDTYLINKLEFVWNTKKEKRLLSEIIEDLSSKNGWNVEDIEDLAAFEVDAYYDYFKSKNSDDLYICVKTCLRIGNVSNTDESYITIRSKIREALREIASENRLNKLRISTIYEIDFDEIADNK